jgi:OOP family OmpA-OmpF porin
MFRSTRTFLVMVLLIAGAATPPSLWAQGGFIGRMKQKAQDKLQNKIDSTADTLSGRIVDQSTGAVACVATNKECMTKALGQGKPVVVTDASGKKVSSADSARAVAAAGASHATTTRAPMAGTTTGATPASASEFKTYQNYDFVPGDKIVFEDDFATDNDGEFPAHWKLIKGQAVINKMHGVPVFALTDGNYVEVAPRMTTARYLSDPFTVEFDHYRKDGEGDVLLWLMFGSDDHAEIDFRGDGVSSAYVPNVGDLHAPYPGGDLADGWHHAALVFKNGQIKAYEDQYRVLVMPDAGGIKPQSIEIAGGASQEHPIIIRNVRIANGGGMTLIDKLTKEGRIVTHGILFDVNRSDVKPQSMGTVQQIVALLNANQNVNLEIGGHTDADGDAAKNLALSQSRADAVKALLVSQGIAANRLTTKGYGATKPIDSNATPEGKANNRRVELVRVP